MSWLSGLTGIDIDVIGGIQGKGWGSGAKELEKRLGFIPDYSQVQYPKAPSWTPYEEQLEAYKADLEAQKKTGMRVGGTQIARTAGTRGTMSATTIPQIYGNLEGQLEEQYARAMGTATATARGQFAQQTQQYQQFMAQLQMHQVEAEATGQQSFWGSLMDLWGMGTEAASLATMI
jgi:hypothetical protein